ncbi:MAG TPA: AlkA N-terminal domain-containing protein [Woeseiaceae bacterium]|nr:AlkA N-terminal domain-containing protein [Woeseiaceae bacterium]
MMPAARLAYRAPFNWQSALSFYGHRVTPGVEAVEHGRYRRTLNLHGQQGIVEVGVSRQGSALELTLHGIDAAYLPDVAATARSVFDVDAPVEAIAGALSRDPLLATLIERHPGMRVPGAWDGFELAVRAILGQQVSVKAATTLAGRVAARYGEPLAAADSGTLTRVFPTPARLRRARFNNIGLVRSRAATLRRLAAAVADGHIAFAADQDVDDFRRRLTAIRGIGDWTAQYVAMRALKHGDALPASDLGLLKALAPPRRVSPATLVQRAERWRPWRAYAVMLLWHSLPGAGG